MLINLRNALMAGKRLPYDAEVEYLRVDAVGPYIVIDGVTYCNAVGTYYAFTISSGGVVTHDLIPVRLGNTGYMYDRITNKRFGNAGSGDFVLGPDVVPVEYIESHGTEWIDTGFVPSGQTKWELDAMFPTGSGFSPMGAMSTSPDSRFLIGREQNPSYFNMSCGPNNAMRITVDGSRKLFVLDAQNDTWRIGDTSGTFPTGTFDTSAIRSVYLFARNKNGSAEYFNNGSRVFKSKLYNSNAIIQNSIPIRVGTDATSWEGAMMDVLTRRIYRNAGTGAFGYGNDLEYPIPAE